MDNRSTKPTLDLVSALSGLINPVAECTRHHRKLQPRLADVVNMPVQSRSDVSSDTEGMQKLKVVVNVDIIGIPTTSQPSAYDRVDQGVTKSRSLVIAFPQQRGLPVTSLAVFP